MRIVETTTGNVSGCPRVLLVDMDTNCNWWGLRIENLQNILYHAMHTHAIVIRIDVYQNDALC
jgi:hypothetical protein